MKKRKKKVKQKPLKVIFKFKENVSKEEEDRIWSQFFDIVLSKDIMDDKLEKIEKLNKTLKPQQELGGAFLPHGVEKQFNFMFVAEMPSMSTSKNISSLGGNFNVSMRDKFFQEMMVKYGVAGSYVTDIVKKGDIPRRPTKEEIQKWLPFLLKEIEIIQPKVIVVLGKRTYEASFKPFVEPHISKNIKIDYVFHYSSQIPRNKFERKFSEVINKLSSGVE